MGAGECSAIACTVHRQYDLAIDDKVALKRFGEELKMFDSPIIAFRTQALVVIVIGSEFRTTGDADEIEEDWARNHEFQLKLDSFAK